MRSRNLLMLLLALLPAVFTAGCSAIVQDVKAVNPQEGTEVVCETSQGTDCYIGVATSFELQQNLYLCLHVTFNRGTPDYWEDGSGPIATASDSKIWTMLSGGFGEDNPYGVPPFLVTLLLTDRACEGSIPPGS